MAQREFEVIVDLQKKEASDFILNTLDSIEDINEFEQNGDEIFASTKANMKTFGDQIYIKLTDKDSRTHIYIKSQTPNQLVDWGRNKTNIDNIINPLLKYECNSEGVCDEVNEQKNKKPRNIFFTCPDCGKKWINSEHPNNCDICGCPSEYFEKAVTDERKPKATIVSTKQNTEGKKEKYIIIGSVAITIFILIIFFTSKQSYEESSSHDTSYEELDGSKNSYENNENMSSLCSHSWKTILSGDPYGECMLEVIKFNSNGTGHVNEMHYAGGNKINASNFDFSFELRGNEIIVDGYTEFTFDGHNLFDSNGRHYQSGNSLQY